MTRQGKTKVVVITILAASVISACSHRKKYYICQCTGRVQGTGHDTVLALGEIPQAEAYPKCFVLNDSVDTCVMMSMY